MFLPKPRYQELALALMGVWVCWAKEVTPGFGLSWESSPVSTGVGVDGKGLGIIQSAAEYFGGVSLNRPEAHSVVGGGFTITSTVASFGRAGGV